MSVDPGPLTMAATVTGHPLAEAPCADFFELASLV